MPTLNVKDVRIPELHLPEMSRDDITRAIGDAARDVDLSRFDPRRLELPDFSGIGRELSKVDLTKVDVPKAVATATTLGRATGRSRLPFVFGGLVTLGLIAFAVASSPLVRPKLEELARKARAEFEARKAAHDDALDTDAHAFDAAVAVPIEPAAFSTDAPIEGTPFDGSAPLPEGFGAAVEDLSPDRVKA